jgi:hypothetical protein
VSGITQPLAGSRRSLSDRSVDELGDGLTKTLTSITLPVSVVVADFAVKAEIFRVESVGQ